MSAKRPLVYLGIFAVLALFYYFYEYKGGEVRKARQEREQKAILFSADSVESFTITSRREGEEDVFDTLSLKHTTSGWRITTPLSVPADSGSVARLLSSAAGARINRVVEDSAADLSIFGLDKPKLLFELTPIGSDTSLSLCLGNKNPTESYIYALNTARPRRVILLNSWIFSDLNKSVHDLRDKQVLHLEEDRVSRVVIEEGNKERLQLEKTDDGWYLRTPLSVPADKDSVDKLLQELADAEAVRFIDTLDQQDLKQYGLDPPVLTAKIFEEQGEALRSLFIGGQDTSGNYFARRQGMDNVYLVKKDLVTRLKSEPSSLRDRSIVREPKDSIELVTISTGGETVTAYKDTAELWRIAEPDSTRADGPAVDGLLWDLKNLRAVKFVDEPAPLITRSFKAPFLEIAYRAQGKLNQLTFARTSPLKRDSLVYLKASHLPGIAALDSAEVAALAKSYNDLRYRKIVEFDSEDITRIRLETSGEEIELAREDGNWRITSPEEAEAKSWKVQNILWDLGDLDFERIVAETMQDSARYGFDRPNLRISLWKEDSLVATLVFADSIPGQDELYLRKSGDSRIFGVEKRIFRGIPTTVKELKKEKREEK